MDKQNNSDVMLKVDNVSKTFSLTHNVSLKDSFVRLVKGKRVQKKEFKALNHVSFEVHKGESVGLIGRNGSGKSTLLKLISGVMNIDEGQILARGRIAGLIEVGAGFHPDLTGRENVYLNGAILGMTKEQIDDKFEQIVAFSEIEKFIDTEVRFYSSGMFLRLAFSVAVFSDPDVFLIDEILAVGDQPFKEKCMKRIRELQDEGKTLVIVSHSEEQIRKVCDRCVWLSHGNLMYDGDVETALTDMNEFEEGITRGYMAQMIYESKGSPKFELSKELTNAYEDVSEKLTPYAKAIWWLKSEGIANGYGNGFFGTDDLANRMTASIMIYNMLGKPAGDENKKGAKADFDNEILTTYADITPSTPNANAVWYLTKIGKLGPVDGYNFGKSELINKNDMEKLLK
ncbi:MAG: ATP-binding cassette domain-containing protein [Candidatus Ancillula sp.]|jgi:ABC-2 type transport system ATP-binding protein|nr:ATP-binding cassette domain-containing protein [Candidatus Ancillula sp.]